MKPRKWKIKAMTKRARERAVVKRMNELRELLREFGARLSGYDPGVTAYLPSGERIGYAGEHLDFSRTEWDWLEPLLIELRDARLTASRRKEKR